ncbi:hypothetical protein AVP43_00935 [Geobacillus stearothermophilus]|nr:hypothetical protein AVP43_00935 [Geobacillus stearothermophilus]
MRILVKEGCLLSRNDMHGFEMFTQKLCEQVLPFYLDVKAALEGARIFTERSMRNALPSTWG